MDEKYETVREIRTQPTAIEAVLNELDEKRSTIEEVMAQSTTFCLIGCGTSYFLSRSGSALLNESGSSVAVPGSEVFMSPNQLPNTQPDVIIPVSRSGESSETVRATEQLQERYPDATVMGITCTNGSTIYEQSDIPIVSNKGTEKSVVMTKSFSSMLVALEYISQLKSSTHDISEGFRTLPEDSEAIVEQAEEIGEKLGARTDLETFMFLGSGELHGVASEAMLKLEEMTLSWTKAYHSLEFRHGPRSIANENTLVTVFLSGEKVTAYQNLLTDIKETGAEILAVGPEEDLDDVRADHKLPLPARETLNMVLYTPVFQFLGYYRALAKGLNPDSPRNLTQVVKF